MSTTLYRRNAPNTPGLRRMYIFFGADILSFPERSSNNTLNEPPTFSPGAKIYSLFTDHLDAELTIDNDFDDQGNTYEQEISLIFPQYSTDAALIMQILSGRDCLIVAEDMELKKYLLGTKAFPMQTKIRYSSGGDSGMTGYRLTFSGQTPDVSPGVSFDLSNLTEISLLQGPNPPGIARIEVIKVDDILNFPEPNLFSEILENPVTIGGSTLLELVAANAGATYNYTIQQSNDGFIIDNEVEIALFIRESDVKQLKELTGRDLVLILHSLNGASYLLGSAQYPILSRLRQKTGGQNGIYGYDVTFTGLTYYPASIFRGSLVPGVPPDPEPPTPAPSMVDFDPNDFTELDFY